MELPITNKNVSLSIHPWNSGTYPPKSLCDKVGQLLQCKSEIRLSGSYSVKLNFVDPNKITLIQSCSYNCKFNIQIKVTF
jgi:hypothetical protein